MHPGNLFLVHKNVPGLDNQGPKAGDIAVVDFGIMGEIDKKTRLAIAEIFIGFLHHDYKKVAQLHVKAGLVPANTNIHELALSCQKIGEEIVDSSVKEISLAKLLTHLIKMTHEYKMDTRPELLLLQKTLLLVEGVGVMLDENLNIWDLARPWVKEWAKKNIGFDAKIRDAIVDLFEAISDAIHQ
jgi:ubiquinone biosynthesis protein